MIKVVKGHWVPLLIGIIIVWVVINDAVKSLHARQQDATSKRQGSAIDSTWVAPSLFLDNEPKGKQREMVIYGQDLIAHTAVYFGPHGSIVSTSNGMNCQNCHLDAGTRAWGKHSYNDGAGLYRLSSFASFVYNNMPFGQASYQHPQLSQEEAWDVAAFVNAQPRPHFNQQHDWPDVSKKPFDAPFGPYADSFPERQHKYGPFQPIANAVKKNK